MRSKGDKAFERCDVKTVKFDGLVKDPTTQAVYKLISKKGQSIQDGVHAGHIAALSCPRTEDDAANTVSSVLEAYLTKPEALESLKHLAGKLLCGSCRFSSMSPVEVSTERSKLARAEAERIEAYSAMRLAQEELALIEAASGDPVLIAELTERMNVTPVSGLDDNNRRQLPPALNE